MGACPPSARPLGSWVRRSPCRSLGLVLVLGVPELDVHWEHHPSHFWLVLGVAAIDVALGLVVSEAARQRRDVRLFLVSMVLLAAAGFLALHALATPGVVLDGPNGGFVLATPVGLLIASGFAAWSATDLEPHEEAILRLEPWIRLGLLLVIVAWAVLSLLEVPPMDRGVRHRAHAVVLRALTPIGIAAYAFAAWRYVAIYRERRRPLPLAVARRSCCSPRRSSRSPSAARGGSRGGSGTC